MKDAILKISHLPVFFIAINKKEVIWTTFFIYQEIIFENRLASS
jgi:hypothetical protein